MPGRIEAVKSGASSFLQVELDHHILGDLPAFRSPILQPAQPAFHIGKAALEARRQGLVRQGRPDNRLQDLVHICEALDRIGQRLVVDLRVLGAQAVAEGTVVDH